VLLAGPFQIETGHGKRCCDLDIKTEAGAAALRRLVGSADVFSRAQPLPLCHVFVRARISWPSVAVEPAENFRVGRLEEAGFGVEQCRQMRRDAGQPEGLVYISMNAFGHDHAWEGRAGKLQRCCLRLRCALSKRYMYW